MSKTVLVRAYTSCNLGDDLFIKILIERYPGVKFELIAGEKYKQIFIKHTNLNIIQQPEFNSMQRILNKILYKYSNSLFAYSYYKLWYHFFKSKRKHIDAYILIGGSIFWQSQDEKLNTRTIINHATITGLKCIPKFVVGANFGPFFEKKYLDRYKSIFNRFDDVCFRDLYSKQLFNELPNVRFAPDIVFQMQVNPGYNKIPKTVGFSVMDFSENKKLFQYEDAFIRLVTHLIEFYSKSSYIIYLCSFCKTEGDERCAEKIYTNLSPDAQLHTKKKFYEGNIPQFLEMLSGIEILFATRFHAMVLGMLFKQKVFPITYSEKMTNVLSDLKFKGKFLKLEECNQLQIIEIVKNVENNQFDVNMREKAMEHFSKLDELLL